MAIERAKRLVVYTDGRCPFCQWSRRQVEHYDWDGRVEFRDYNDPIVARESPFSDAKLAAEMHVHAQDGGWHGGFAAWLNVLRVLPLWRWLGRLLGWVPFRWIGPMLYRLIARNRYRMPAFLLRCIGAPPPCSPDAVCAIR